MRSISTRAVVRDRNDDGFTLIELMVVVLIIAILIAIAIPTFLGARKRAQDRATQSDLRNALTVQKTFYTDGEKYATNTPVGSAALVAIEPRLKWMSQLSWNTGNVTLPAGTAIDAVLCLEQSSKSGTTFALGDIAAGSSAGTFFMDGPCPGTLDETSFAGWNTNGW